MSDITMHSALPNLTLLVDEDTGEIYGAVERVGDGKYLAAIGRVVNDKFKAMERVRNPLLLGPMRGLWFSEEAALFALRSMRAGKVLRQSVADNLGVRLSERSLWGVD